MKISKVLRILLIIIFSTNCYRNNIDESCPMFSNVPRQPYEAPIWHPSGEIIGFNHLPIKEIDYNYGYDCPMQASYSYDYDSLGFYLINADGTNLRRVLPYYLQTPVWSHDGKWIAFSNGGQIFKMPFNGEEFDTTAIIQLTFEGNNYFPAWSPDDKWIAYDSNFDSENGMFFIWIMSDDGNNKRRIDYEPNIGEIRMPWYNSHGKFIVHIRYVNNTSEIFFMDTAGNNLQRITNNSNEEAYPKYNPQNETIAYYSQGSVPERRGIWILKAEQDSNPELLVPEAVTFSWSPDGRYIVYQLCANNYRIDDKYGTVWIINVETKEKRQLTHNYFNLIIN